MNRQVEANIKRYLIKRWSPEQIYHRLKQEGEEIVCTESIYKFIYDNKENGGDLWKYLRRAHRRRKRRFPSHYRRGKIQDAIPIKKRSSSANKRLRLGDWERDTMIGLDRKTCILALVDRKSRYKKFIKLNRRLAPKITAATFKALKDLPVTSITNDRGLEFADHKNCADKLGVKIFFCDPYSSSQRGRNENRIGILRQYFPKQTDLKKINSYHIRKVEFEINNRPMKCLDWKTPYEVMFKKGCTRKW